MAEDLTKGMHTLLSPKFSDFAARLDKLEMWCKELSAQVNAKEERLEVDALRDHTQTQLKQVDGIIAMVKEKMCQLDDLRTREMRALQTEVEQKASAHNVALLRDQIQQTNVAVSTKAEIVKLEQLGKQLEKLSEEMVSKAAETRVDQVARQVQSLSENVSEKVHHSVTDVLRENLKELTAVTSEKATTASVSALGGKVQALSGECAQMVKSARVDAIASQVSALEQDVARKSDDAKVDHVLRSVNAVSDEISQKAHTATVDQALRHVHTLTQAMSKKAEIEKHDTLSQQFNKLTQDLVDHRAEVDKNTHGLDALARRVAQDSAKLRNIVQIVESPASPLASKAGGSVGLGYSGTGKSVFGATGGSVAATPRPGSGGGSRPGALAGTALPTVR